MADTNATQNPNHSLDRRREEKATENLMQDSVARLSSVASDGLEIWQKNLAFGSTIANYWADTFKVAQTAIGQMITQTEQHQNRRSA
jgi:hypothetical protein